MKSITKSHFLGNFVFQTDDDNDDDLFGLKDEGVCFCCCPESTRTSPC